MIQGMYAITRSYSQTLILKIKKNTVFWWKNLWISMNNISLHDRHKIQSIPFLSKNLSHLLSSHWKIRAQKAALGMSSTSSKYEPPYENRDCARWRCPHSPRLPFISHHKFCEGLNGRCFVILSFCKIPCIIFEYFRFSFYLWTYVNRGVETAKENLQTA